MIDNRHMTLIILAHTKTLRGVFPLGPSQHTHPSKFSDSPGGIDLAFVQAPGKQQWKVVLCCE